MPISRASPISPEYWRSICKVFFVSVCVEISARKLEHSQSTGARRREFSLSLSLSENPPLCLSLCISAFLSLSLSLSRSLPPSCLSLSFSLSLYVSLFRFLSLSLTKENHVSASIRQESCLSLWENHVSASVQRESCLSLSLSDEMYLWFSEFETSFYFHESVSRTVCVDSLTRVMSLSLSLTRCMCGLVRLKYLPGLA